MGTLSSWRARQNEPITGSGGLGQSPRLSPGAEPLVSGSGEAKLLEAERPLAFGHPIEAANLPFGILVSVCCTLS